VSRLVLASQSAARRALLQAAGLAFEAVVSGVDEGPLKDRLAAAGAGGDDIAEALAEAKALAISRMRPGDLVIGADQILEADGGLRDKPVDLADARARLRELRGTEHRLRTSVVAARNGEIVFRDSATPRLRMRDLTDREIDAYLDAVGDAALASVGAYMIEGPGLRLFDAVEGRHDAILGMPLLGLFAFLRTERILDW